MRLGTSMMIGAALAFAAGCGGAGGNDTEYVEATPDLSGLALEINESSDEGQKLVADGFATYESALEGNGPEYLEGARMQIKALNGALKQAVSRVVELANGDLRQSEPGDVFTYGPKDAAEATYRLKVKRLEGRRFAWKLEARPLGSTDDAAYKLVAAGRMARGDVAHRGRGTIGVNLDNLKSVAPNTTGQGKLLASFAHPAPGAKALAYRLANFTPDPSKHDAVTGAFVGHKLANGNTRIRIFGHRNLPQTATAAKETVFSTIRFNKGIGGRADILVAGGDIPDNQFYIGAACWDAQEMEKFKVLRHCTKRQGQLPLCEKVLEQGTRDACAVDLRGEDAPPAEDKGNIGQEPGSPDSPEDVPTDVTADF